MNIKTQLNASTIINWHIPPTGISQNEFEFKESFSISTMDTHIKEIKK